MLKQVNWQLSLFDTYDRQGNDGKKDKIQKYKALVAEYETDGSMKFVTGEDLELWYRDKIKGTVRPKWNLMKRYKKQLYKVRTGEILMS